MQLFRPRRVTYNQAWNDNSFNIVPRVSNEEGTVIESFYT